MLQRLNFIVSVWITLFICKNFQDRAHSITPNRFRGVQCTMIEHLTIFHQIYLINLKSNSESQRVSILRDSFICASEN